MLATCKSGCKLDRTEISDVEQVMSCLNSPECDRSKGSLAAGRLNDRLSILKRRSKLFEQVSLSSQVCDMLNCTKAE
jgi:hypothetical protein